MFLQVTSFEEGWAGAQKGAEGAKTVYGMLKVSTVGGKLSVTTIKNFSIVPKLSFLNTFVQKEAKLKKMKLATMWKTANGKFVPLGIALISTTPISMKNGPAETCP